MRIICEYLESTERFLQNAPFFLLFFIPAVCLLFCQSISLVYGHFVLVSIRLAKMCQHKSKQNEACHMLQGMFVQPTEEMYCKKSPQLIVRTTDTE